MTHFWLGVHQPHWLATAGIPLFVSRRALERYKRLPRAAADWALDSGGFSELSLHGGWHMSARDYAHEVRRFRDEVGRMSWAAPQDWMCEPAMLKRTGLTVARHQALTIANYLDLRAVAPELPFIPVLQGWQEGDYHDHVEQYARAGVELSTLPLVGIGSVCRRQSSGLMAAVVITLARAGLRLHGFGVKLQGLQHTSGHLASADSMAWSYGARRAAQPLIAAHVGKHKNCANCLEYAFAWREQVLVALDTPERQTLLL